MDGRGSERCCGGRVAFIAERYASALPQNFGTAGKLWTSACWPATRETSRREAMGDASDREGWNRSRDIHGGSRPAVDRTSCVREEDAKDAAPCDRFGAQAVQGDRFVTKRLLTTKKKMLADREVRAAYDVLADEFDLARELIAARVRAGMTQAEVAERMGTTQSVVARLESGARMPSVNTLLKFAKATRSRPIIKLLAA